MQTYWHIRPSQTGMTLTSKRCPQCGSRNSRLSKRTPKGLMQGALSRVHRCRDCGSRFKTLRPAAILSLLVVGIAALGFALMTHRLWSRISLPKTGEFQQRADVAGEPSAELKSKAQLGDREAQYRLGRWHRDAGGVDDDRRAVEWFRKAGERGHLDANFYLGLHYAEGRGVLQDYPTAMTLTLKLAEASHAEAQAQMGTFFRRGMGTPIDKIRAYVWYNLAGANGSRDALPMRDVLGSQMSPTELAEAQAEARALEMRLQKGEGAGKLGLIDFATSSTPSLQTQPKPEIIPKFVPAPPLPAPRQQ